MNNKCFKCNKYFKKSSIHIHHITYIPEKTIQLCKYCHGYISSIDSLARRYYFKLFNTKVIRNSELDNSLRELMFSHFIKFDIHNFNKGKRILFIKNILNQFKKYY
jgi:hypothetical protein